MKTLLLIVTVGVVLFFVFQGGSFLKNGYSSELMGVSFKFPMRMDISADSSESIAISYPKPSTNQILIRKIGISDTASSLAFSLSRDFPAKVSAEKPVKWGRDGISFSWRSIRGDEKAFAFSDDRYLYVVTTFGMEAKGRSIDDMEAISNSVVLSKY